MRIHLTGLKAVDIHCKLLERLLKSFILCVCSDLIKLFIKTASSAEVQVKVGASEADSQRSFVSLKPLFEVFSPRRTAV